MCRNGCQKSNGKIHSYDSLPEQQKGGESDEVPEQALAMFVPSSSICQPNLPKLCCSWEPGDWQEQRGMKRWAWRRNCQCFCSKLTCSAILQNPNWCLQKRHDFCKLTDIVSVRWSQGICEVWCYNWLLANPPFQWPLTTSIVLLERYYFN